MGFEDALASTHTELMSISSRGYVGVSAAYGCLFECWEAF